MEYARSESTVAYQRSLARGKGYNSDLLLMNVLAGMPFASRQQLDKLYSGSAVEFQKGLGKKFVPGLRHALTAIFRYQRQMQQRQRGNQCSSLVSKHRDEAYNMTLDRKHNCTLL